MQGQADLVSALEVREFRYRSYHLQSWIDAHEKWWPKCEDPSVWGCFAAQAKSGRYSFSNRNQARRHFAETWVGRQLERCGYICWTNAKILRKPSRSLHGQYASQTRFVEALLRESLGIVPQVEYEKRYLSSGVRLKNVDIVGFHCGRDHWVFTEVKKDRDRLHPEQRAALLFLRELFPTSRADVFVAAVQTRGR